VAIQSVTIFSNAAVVMPAWVAMTISRIACSPPASAAFHVALEQGGKRLLVLPFGMLRREGFYTVDGEEELKIDRLLGPQRAVVVEDVAMRSATGTKSGELSRVTRSTKVTIAFLGAVSFQEGKGSAATDGFVNSSSANRILRIIVS
jgi:hypothetical protein